MRGEGGEAEFDRLRRAVYGPDPDPALVQRYEALVAERAVAADRRTELPASLGEAEPLPEPTSVAANGRRRGRVLAVAIPAAIVVVALAVAGVQATSNARALPMSLVPPALSGASLVAYGTLRLSSPATTGLRYNPYGYTVFQPTGGSLHVALRCVGTGRVVITAGQRFAFRCPGPDRVLHLDDDTPHTKPFVVMGITSGDVVWAVRITERPCPTQTSRTAPSDSATPAERFRRLDRCLPAPPVTSPTPTGGATPSSTRSTRAASRTATATGSVTSPAY